MPATARPRSSKARRKDMPAVPYRTRCVVGVQWGDEGKGKIVDLLSREADVVVRFQGGGNAGHTVVSGKQKFVLHLIPSGILHKGTTCVIANGVVVDLVQLLDEIRELGKRGIDVAGHLLLSERAHLVMPWHKELDGLSERTSAQKIGTTQRGIGPCYADKAARKGVRVADLYNPTFLKGRLEELVSEKSKILKALYGARGLDANEIWLQYRKLAEEVEPYVADVTMYINEAIDSGRRILFEGAQGSMLDIDFGTYPYVTSSNSDACGISAGAGVPPKKIGTIIGIAKAYCTRVGGGPFPTELQDALGERIRQIGHEYGATTGRPRRCGWFDLIAARHAIMINGVDELAITKLDVLDALDEVKVGVAYELDGRRIERIPVDVDSLARCVPIYRAFPGWHRDTSKVRRFATLPREARAYLEFLEASLGVRISIVSVGTERLKTILR